MHACSKATTLAACMDSRGHSGVVLPDQDGGDPAVDASPRDVVYTLPAAEAASNPDAKPRKLAQTDLRCVALQCAVQVSGGTILYPIIRNIALALCELL